MLGLPFRAVRLGFQPRYEVDALSEIRGFDRRLGGDQSSWRRLGFAATPPGTDGGGLLVSYGR